MKFVALTPEQEAAVVTTASGLKYVDFVVGEGAAVGAGQTAVVHYSGWLTDGSLFDSSVQRNETFSFRVGAKQVIAAWDEGVGTMRVGGKRRLIAPGHLAYGSRGYPGVIPPNATLVFDVECVGVR
jgi:FKBP-type peptidyl-prolyl cis-trans isomerase